MLFNAFLCVLMHFIAIYCVGYGIFFIYSSEIEVASLSLERHSSEVEVDRSVSSGER